MRCFALDSVDTHLSFHCASLNAPSSYFELFDHVQNYLYIEKEKKPEIINHKGTRMVEDGED